MAQRFTENCKKLGLVIHGDFIIGLPGETRDSIRKTIDFAKRLDTETIQVSIDWKSVVEGKRGDLGGRRIIKKKKGLESTSTLDVTSRSTRRRTLSCTPAHT